MTTIIVGNSVDSRTVIQTGGGGKLAGKSGSISEFGNSVNNHVKNVQNIKPGSYIEIGGTRNANATARTGNGAGLGSGNSGSIWSSGNAVNQTFDAGTGFFGTAVVGNAQQVSTDVTTGKGGALGGKSGTVSSTGNSVNTYINSTQLLNATMQPIIVNAANTQNVTVQAATHDANWAGDTGSVKDSGNAVGTTGNL